MKSQSIAEKLLIAAYTLEVGGKRPFSAEDLVVEAWRQYPDAFGLAGYNHPDSNRVFAEVMGSKPLRARGLLRKVGPKMYELTESGIEQARSSRPSLANAQKISLSREYLARLSRLIQSKAVKKFISGASDRITFYDACLFWGISPRSTAMEYSGKINNIESVVSTALNAIRNESATFSHGGIPIGKSDVQRLLELNEWLKNKFSEQISTILERKDER